MKIPAWLDLPELGCLDFDFPKLDAVFADPPDLGFDLEALDKLLDLVPGEGRSFCGPLKNARARQGVQWRGREEIKTDLRRENPHWQALPSSRQRKGRPVQAAWRQKHRAEDARG